VPCWRSIIPANRLSVFAVKRPQLFPHLLHRLVVGFEYRLQPRRLLEHGFGRRQLHEKIARPFALDRQRGHGVVQGGQGLGQLGRQCVSTRRLPCMLGSNLVQMPLRFAECNRERVTLPG
jgi:hypothetical protein